MNFLGPLERTPRADEKPVCFACKYCAIRRDFQGAVLLHCGVDNRPVTRELMHCTSFYPKNEPALYEYEALAWMWASDETAEPKFVRLRDLAVGGSPVPRRIGFWLVRR